MEAWGPWGMGGAILELGSSEPCYQLSLFPPTAEPQVCKMNGLKYMAFEAPLSSLSLSPPPLSPSPPKGNQEQEADGPSTCPAQVVSSVCSGTTQTACPL